MLVEASRLFVTDCRQWYDTKAEALLSCLAILPLGYIKDLLSFFFFFFFPIKILGIKIFRLRIIKYIQLCQATLRHIQKEEN